jgi:hypothetical protein
MKQRAKRILLFDDDYFLLTSADMFLRGRIRAHSAEHAATLRQECYDVMEWNGKQRIAIETSILARGLCRWTHCD